MNIESNEKYMFNLSILFGYQVIANRFIPNIFNLNKQCVYISSLIDSSCPNLSCPLRQQDTVASGSKPAFDRTSVVRRPEILRNKSKKK